jgi:coenzyme F420-reducing hydrogenase alpha subunit
LLVLRKKLQEAQTRLDAIVDLMAALRDKFPVFHRPTEYIGLVSPAEYALLWGEVGSSQVQTRPARFYKDVTKEYSIPLSTAKWTKGAAGPYMVGALARFNLNYDLLNNSGKSAANKLGLLAPCHNPFLITLAQLVEAVHSAEDALVIVDKLLARGLRDEGKPVIKPLTGKGFGAVEVPRGLLFHAYEYDNQGRVVKADCVIPTNQNHANIQKDLETLTPKLADLSEAEIELRLSMLVRAYDPCISCSTHMIDLTGGRPGSFVKFVRK